MHFKTSISKEEINKLPLYEYAGRITLIDRTSQIHAAVQELRQHEVLGFDTETRAAFKKGERYDVSLLQLGTPEHVFLFRLNLISLNDEISQLLSDPHIIKAGVAVRDDLKALKKLHPFQEEGFCDLAKLAQELEIENFGLRALCALCLEQRLSKKEQTSNWEKQQLSQGQLHYAACDAAVGHQIFHVLRDRKTKTS